MGYTTLQNTPITIDLIKQGSSRGWTVDGDDAIHEVCNAGFIELVGFQIIAGLTYDFSYQIKSINNGLVRPQLGGSVGITETQVGFFNQSLTAITNENLKFYSDANTTISLFNIKTTTEDVLLNSTNTIAWSEKNNKWSDFRSYNPDCGFSLFANMFTYKNGKLNAHQAGNIRNNFYGVQYKSIIEFAANSQKSAPKTFGSISYEADGLMITTVDGIKTSLGQLSELIDQDFLKDILDDGISTVEVFDVEGVYSAGFMKEKPDIINGRELKGTYATIELIQDGVGFIRLKNVYIHSEQSKIGSR